MTLPADFADAHRRHWEDAELLFEHHRWGNADQLYGLSAECGLKALMVKLGMAVHPDDKPMEAKYRRHLPSLWSVFRTFMAGRGGEWYLARLPSGEPFRGWSIHDRYASSRHFSQPVAAAHQSAARALRILIHLAALHGRL